MNKGYKQFVDQLNEATTVFPSLYESIFEGKIILKGSLPVVDKKGRLWENYNIEIHCSENYPYEFPKLYETSGKIPKIGDWHIYEDTLSCCVKVQPEEILRCKNGITVTEYIQEEVLSYLFNQTHRRVEGYYVNGEYAHGVAGIFQFYAETLRTGKNIKLTLELMNFIATHDRPIRTSLCFCGKKIKFRHCHRDAFDKLKAIGDIQLKKHGYEIAHASGII